MLDAVSIQDVLFAVGAVISFGIGLVGGLLS